MWAQWARFAFLPVTSSHFPNDAKRSGHQREGSPWQSCPVPLEIQQVPAAICCRLLGEGRLSCASQVSLLFLVTSSGLVMTASLLRVRELI